jgi:hypothetical protein
MIFLADLLGMLAFRPRALHSLAGRGACVTGVLLFSIGFLAYVLTRNKVYAPLPGIVSLEDGAVRYFSSLHFFQILLFLLIIYVPAIIILSKAISTDGFHLSVSALQYRAHIAVLFPLWGLLNLIAAPLQWLEPRFLILWVFEISFGMFIRTLLILVYTLWAVGKLNSLSPAQSIGALTLSCFAFWLYYWLIELTNSLPF